MGSSGRLFTKVLKTFSGGSPPLRCRNSRRTTKHQDLLPPDKDVRLRVGKRWQSGFQIKCMRARRQSKPGSEPMTYSNESLKSCREFAVGIQAFYVQADDLFVPPSNTLNGPSRQERREGSYCNAK
jgi:hypothetical protein